MTLTHIDRFRSAVAAAVVVLAITSSAPAVAQSAAAAGKNTRVQAADAEQLMATIRALTAPGMDGRGTGTPGGAKARAWIVERFGALGLEPLPGREFTWPFALTTKAGAPLQGVNVIGLCPGRRPQGPVIVVSAHYDHLGIRDGQTYHGADDNASGVAMLLAVAARCVAAPFEHTLIVAAFDAEEHGLQGAHAFVTAPPVPAGRIALDVNFDMVSRSAARELYVAGPGRWPKLKPPLESPAARAAITVKFGHDTGGGHEDWTTQSDHGAFHAAGIPFVYFGVEDHADYHKPTDTAEKIAPAFVRDVAAFVIDSLEALDRLASFK